MVQIQFLLISFGILISQETYGIAGFNAKDTLLKSEPYPYISGSFYGHKNPLSPDPLVNYRWKNPKASDGLEIYTLKPVLAKTDNPASFKNLHSITTDNPDVTVNGSGSFMLDFGQENAAWLEIDSPDLTDTIQMSISEYNEPAILNNGAKNRIKTKKPVRYGNTYRLELNPDLYEGVRFGWIHVTQFSKPWHITGIWLVCQVKPTNYNGSFSCSDTMLTRIWYTGAYVVKLNLLKDYFGAILMERSDRYSWTGDAHPSQAASMVAFGNYDFVKANLERTSKQNNGILSYSLLWVLSLLDYYNYTGDSATLGKFLVNACNKLDLAYKHYGTNPELGFYGWDERLVAGFENADCTESQNAYKMLSIRAWNEFSKAMQTYGRKDLADKYEKCVIAKVSGLRQDNNWFEWFGLHAAADAVNAGFTSSAEHNLLFLKEFNDRVNRQSYSPFNQYFVIQAMAAMGKYDDAISSAKDCWGGQMNYGGTAFFEVYRPSWNKILGKNDAPPNNQCGYTSLAHPWSAGVPKWLSEVVLGIKPSTPGFKTFDILPHLGRTITSVSGKIPTINGEISASFDINTGKCAVSVPSGTTARIGIPKVEKSISRIEVNGKKTWDGKYRKTKGIATIQEDKDFVYLMDVGAGNYNILVEYKGTTPGYTEPAIAYPGELIKEDTLTKGSWGGIYGTEGYVLCNYNGEKNDVRKLPPFVTSIHYGRSNFKPWLAGTAAHKQWAVGTSDLRALAADSANAFPRNIGCIHTQDPRPCLQTTTVDIETSAPKPYQIALYFVDWDNKERRTAIEIFDLETKKLIAPVQIVQNYENGKYLIYKYNKSIRIRIDQVRGENAVLSGIFFD